MEVTWSEWLDFNSEQASMLPESPGVYMMHAAMKILYIGGTSNLKKSITEALNTSCVRDAKRFRYFATNEHDSISQSLLSKYKEKHDGNLPRCMS
jgi:excinuclease UvrABC nuclease subunit